MPVTFASCLFSAFVIIFALFVCRPHSFLPRALFLCLYLYISVSLALSLRTASSLLASPLPRTTTSSSPDFFPPFFFLSFPTPPPPPPLRAYPGPRPPSASWTSTSPDSGAWRPGRLEGPRLLVLLQNFLEWRCKCSNKIQLDCCTEGYTLIGR